MQNILPSVQKERNDDTSGGKNNEDHDYPSHKFDINSFCICSRFTLCCNCVEYKLYYIVFVSDEFILKF